MKPIITNDLKKRIMYASENGSVIAKDLLEAIKKCKDLKNETDKTVNYFDSKRKVHSVGDGRKAITIYVTCCRKDLTNKNLPDYGNPQAPYFPENRQEITIKDFANLFKSIRETTYADTDWRYFDSAIRVQSKIKMIISDKMQDFILAYDESNYINIQESDTSTLHGSCMRYEEKARNAGDFYANFAGAKIMYGTTEQGEVVCRAILWDNMTTYISEDKISFMDRIYTAFDGFLIDMMIKEATEKGYFLKKRYNDYSHKIDFVAIADNKNFTYNDTCADQPTVGIEKGKTLTMKVWKEVPDKKLHKQGAPYCDTMTYLMYDEQDKKMYLCNRESLQDGNKNYKLLASFEMTSGYGQRHKYICANCGKIIDSYNDFCYDCMNEIFEETEFGKTIKTKTVKYKNKIYPAVMIKNNKPKTELRTYMTLKRICEQ